MRSGNGAAFDFLSRFGPLARIRWLCGLVSPFARSEDFARWLPRDHEWPQLVDFASWNGLLFSIHPALEERGLCETVPADALSAFREFHSQAKARRAEAAAQIARVSRALNEAGIEPLWLKGAALLVEGSPWAERRWMSDLDAWVAPARIGEAQACLLRLGYRNDPRYPDASEHHLRPLFHPDETLAIELHHAIAAPEVASLLPLDRIIANARQLRWRDAQVSVPGALDLAVHVASQARPSGTAYLHGRLKTRRVIEFVQLASTIGASDAVAALRNACFLPDQQRFAEEFLAVAGGLCALPGDFDRRAALAGIAWKATFPRMHSLYFGVRAFADRGVRHHLLHPGAFARKVGRHVRHSMDTRW